MGSALFSCLFFSGTLARTHGQGKGLFTKTRRRVRPKDCPPACDHLQAPRRTVRIGLCPQSSEPGLRRGQALRGQRAVRLHHRLGPKALARAGKVHDLLAGGMLSPSRDSPPLRPGSPLPPLLRSISWWPTSSLKRVGLFCPFGRSETVLF